MTEATKTGSIFSSPTMSAEGSPELELDASPIRTSGFIALGLGLLSFVAVLGPMLIVVPALAILTALFAIRPTNGVRPVGIKAAWIGLFCAVLFAAWGMSERHLKSKLMSERASRYASQWLQLVAQGDLELALELQVHPTRRQPSSMPLADYYRRSDTAVMMLKQFKDQESMPALIKAGTKPKWELAMPPTVYTRFGRELTRTVWRDTTGTYQSPLKIELEYLPGKDGKEAQWKIDLVSDYMDDSDRV